MIRTRLLIAALVAAPFAAYTTLSVLRQLHLQSTGYDLGIFDQANDSDVAESNGLVPQLTDRCDVFRLTNLHASAVLPDWVVVTDDVGGEEGSVVAALPRDGYVPVDRGGGLTLYRLVGPPSG